jgi:DNA-binding NarL/FixJ family response regulator
MTSQDGERIRVLAANLPGILGEVVARLIQHEPDMVLVGHIKGSIEVMLEAKSREVDVLILGAAVLTPPPGLCSLLLTEFPHLKILVLSTNTTGATGYWLGVRHYRLPVVSADSVISSIRQLYAETPSL